MVGFDMDECLLSYTLATVFHGCGHGWLAQGDVESPAPSGL